MENDIAVEAKDSDDTNWINSEEKYNVSSSNFVVHNSWSGRPKTSNITANI